VPGVTAQARLVDVAKEIIALLAQDPQAQLKVTLEIRAEFPSGASETLRRAVSENATVLKRTTAEWEAWQSGTDAVRSGGVS